MNARKIFLSERLVTLALCAGVFVLALRVREWTNTWLTDFWGDSYHHWLITRLTMLNGGVYSDYKGLEVVWSPLYHYVSMIPMWLTGETDIRVLHEMNAVWGALACALSAYVAWNLYKSRLAALTAGAVLAFMTWHIAFSGMNVAEVFSGILLLVMLALVLQKKQKLPNQNFSKNLIWQSFLLWLVALAMALTRTDLSVYLVIIVVWLWIQKRYVEAVAIVWGVGIGLGGWSLWSYFKTGNFLHWYQQYTKNNLHDWFLLNEATPNAAFAFAEYLNRLSPFVLPALLAGVLVGLGGGRRGGRLKSSLQKSMWLVTALLAGHSLFLIIGYTRGIVPILTERYLALDLPLAAVLVSGWVVVLGEWGRRKAESGERKRERGERKAESGETRDRRLGFGGLRLTIRDRRYAIRDTRLIQWLVAGVLVATAFFRFQNDIPELEIRRWGIDPEWQVGNFLEKEARAGEVVLTDAPVAIYRSYKDVRDFVSSIELEKWAEPMEALRANKVRWIVAQPFSYDGAARFVPRELLENQRSGTVDGLRFELVWRYDPKKKDIQSQVWHVIEDSQ